MLSRLLCSDEVKRKLNDLIPSATFVTRGVGLSGIKWTLTFLSSGNCVHCVLHDAGIPGETSTGECSHKPSCLIVNERLHCESEESERSQASSS
jgi:hypothetical protein